MPTNEQVWEDAVRDAEEEAARQEAEYQSQQYEDHILYGDKELEEEQ